jgi:Arc/MetJ-type ribon-helix-helix transcriptional regulator
MGVRLTEEQETFVRLAVERGRFSRPEDAVQDALSRWVEMERRRMEIVAALEESEADFAAGRFEVHTPENTQQLAEKIIREAGSERVSEAV